MRLACRAAVLLLVFTPATSQAAADVIGYEKTADGFAAGLGGGRLQLAVCSERAVRVLFTPQNGPALAPSLAVVHPCEGFRDFTVRETQTAFSLVTSRLEARLDRRTGAVSFHDPAGRSVLAETAGGRSLVAAEVLGQKTHHAELRFDWATDEGLYGLGAQQGGLVNYRGHDVLLIQENTIDVVPVLVSSRGYGILWDNASETRLRDARPQLRVRATSHRYTASRCTATSRIRRDSPISSTRIPTRPRAAARPPRCKAPTTASTR